MTDPLEGQGRPMPEVSFVPSKEAIEQAFVRYVKSKPWYEGVSAPPDIKIGKGSLFIATQNPNETATREFYMAKQPATGNLDFSLEIGVGLMCGVSVSKHKYEPYYIEVGGEHGTGVSVAPDSLAEDALSLDFHHNFDFSGGLVIPDWTGCKVGFTHKGRLSLRYDNLNQLDMVGHLAHQVFEVSENREKVADLVRLSTYQVSKLKEGKKVDFSQAGYRYEFALEGEDVTATVFRGDDVKEEIRFPFCFYKARLLQKLIDLEVLDDPLNTPPSSGEKVFITSLPRYIVNWVSHTKLPDHS